jgi:nucleoside-diphosphate-sugar epimerase
MSNRLPQIIVTGSSGFLGRQLLEALKEEFRIFGIARQSQAESESPVHANIVWYQVDIAEREPLEAVFRDIRKQGGAEIVIHLAAHYDFTGDEDPEYWRTNVYGLQNVLEQCTSLRLRRFIFSSSLAACEFPPPGHVLDERSAADGAHVYARSKAAGEELVRRYGEHFPYCIVRFAAMFSDWCEYPPLYKFLETWLSLRWNRRMLGGRGQSAIPYLHVRDAMRFFQHLLDRLDEIDRGELLIASTEGCTTHQELFDAATRDYYGAQARAWHVPRLLCLPGMWGLDLLGRVLGSRPFERPWMAAYVDRQMAVDSSYSRGRLEFAPRPRLHVRRRMPFLIENFKMDPLTWNHRNERVMKQVRLRPNLRVHWLLRRHEEDICERFTERLLSVENAGRFASYRRIAPDEHAWRHRQLLRHLMVTVRTREKEGLLGYCRDLAEQRQREGFSAQEVVAALETLGEVCLEVLRRDADVDGLLEDLHEYVVVPLWLAIDQVEETFDLIAEENERQKRLARNAS